MDDINEENEFSEEIGIIFAKSPFDSEFDEVQQLLSCNEI